MSPGQRTRELDGEPEPLPSPERARGPAIVCASLLLCVFMVAGGAQASTASPPGGQSDEPKSEPPDWALLGSIYLYLTPDADYLQPTMAVNYRWLHVEARYNYEDRNTASTWAGYNFSVGKLVTLEITPMLGGVFGDTNGMTLGSEGTLTWRWFELYVEGEYVLSIGDRSKSFLYNWSTLTASPAEWLRLGVVVQRTRAYETTLEIQRGLLVGVSTKHMAITAYVFNPDLQRPTYVFAFDVSL